MDLVIDFRIRPPLPSFRDQFIFTSHTEERLRMDQSTLPALGRHRDESRSARERSVDLLIEEMNRAGVTHGVVLGRDAGARFGASDNDEIAEFCAASQGRFLGFAGINGADPTAAVAEVRVDDDHLTGLPLQFAVDSVEVADIFSSGDDVAFHARQRGRYLGGLPGVPARDRQELLNCNGMVRVREGAVRAGRVIRDRGGLKARLQKE